MMTTFTLFSKSFGNGEPIPSKYTCDGDNLSPALSWSDLPENTHSMALIVDDPDAPVGTFVHWVLYNIPINLSELREGVTKTKHVSGIGSQGINDFHRTGYDGPCPPRGSDHHYYFTLYALSSPPTLAPGLSAAGLRKAIKGKILAEAQWTGVYHR